MTDMRKYDTIAHELIAYFHEHLRKTSSKKD